MTAPSPNPTPTPLLIEMVGADGGWLPILLTGVFTLAGVGIGLFGNWLMDKRRASREDRQRWYSQIHILASELLESSRQVILKSMTLDSHYFSADVSRQVLSGKPDATYKARLADLIASANTARKVYSRLALIAPTDVRAEAQYLFEKLEEVAVHPPADPKGGEASRAFLNDANSRFEKVLQQYFSSADAKNSLKLGKSLEEEWPF